VYDGGCTSGGFSQVYGEYILSSSARLNVAHAIEPIVNRSRPRRLINDDSLLEARAVWANQRIAGVAIYVLILCIPIDNQRPCSSPSSLWNIHTLQKAHTLCLVVR